MKDDKSKTGLADSPFDKDPFSVDVWERAYKNVGKPFEKSAVDSKVGESCDTDRIAADKKNANDYKDALIERKTRLEEAEKGISVKKPAASSAPKKASAPKLPNYEPQKQRPSVDYERQGSVSESQKSIDSDEEQSATDMITEIFSSIFSEVKKGVGELFGGNTDDVGNLPKIFGIAIIFVIIAILSLLSNLS